MKYLIFSISLLFILNINAQETRQSKEFKYTKTDEKTRFVGYLSVLNSVVYIGNDASSEENHKKVMDHIKSLYEYPEDVILSNNSNEIVIQEQIESLMTSVSMGFEHSADMKYNLTFNIADGEIKCTLSNMQTGNIPIISNDVEMEWVDSPGLYLHRSNGKPRKTMFGITDLKIENHFNALIKNIESF